MHVRTLKFGRRCQGQKGLRKMGEDLLAMQDVINASGNNWRWLPILCVKKISISNRRGTISIAFDDDKVWLSNTGANAQDKYNLRYTTHVRDNRKGIIAHTAISSGCLLPLGLAFERSGDSSYSCFERLFNFMFRSNTGERGLPDLQNVQIASDRGYMSPQLVFGFIIAAGADFVGTVI